MSQRKNAITEKKASPGRGAAAVWAAWADWAAAAWVSDPLKRLFVLCCGLFLPAGMKAQYLPRAMTLNAGEEVTYDVYFKWGFLMSRAGEGQLTFTPSLYGGKRASKYRLTFRTSRFFDSVYKMRDTIECYYSPDYALLHSSKHTSEGGYYLIDELTFSYREREQTHVHSRRYTPERVKIDTLLSVASGYAFDMLGTLFFLRTLDWKYLKKGDVFPSTVVTGKDLIQVRYRYTGNEVVESDGIRYRAHHFFIDIHDAAFSQSKSAAEVWVGNDANHLPLKVRSKLKIGYAEIHYKTSAQLKAPLSCRMEN
ncbi:MAG: DUF3108 domain-containing protein [Tannerella sp.]|jgi:hypothetical protein|nr:DUF3108 domain-containing protein [Tannerella sp.]